MNYSISIPKMKEEFTNRNLSMTIALRWLYMTFGVLL
jgi:hypothetical protein